MHTAVMHPTASATLRPRWRTHSGPSSPSLETVHDHWSSSLTLFAEPGARQPLFQGPGHSQCQPCHRERARPPPPSPWTPFQAPAGFLAGCWSWLSPQREPLVNRKCFPMRCLLWAPVASPQAEARSRRQRLLFPPLRRGDAPGLSPSWGLAAWGKGCWQTPWSPTASPCTPLPRDGSQAAPQSQKAGPASIDYAELLQHFEKVQNQHLEVRHQRSGRGDHMDRRVVL